MGDDAAVRLVRHWHAIGGPYTVDVHKALGSLLAERDALEREVERLEREYAKVRDFARTQKVMLDHEVATLRFRLMQRADIAAAEEAERA